MIQLLKQILKTPPDQIFPKAVRLVQRRLQAKKKRRKDLKQTTYLIGCDLSVSKPFTFFKTPHIEFLLNEKENILRHSEEIFSHRFDLLGSGLIEVRYGTLCPGMSGHAFKMGDPIQADPRGHWLQNRINAANLKESQKIWSMVSPGYQPIDWQLDFKSGFRWNEGDWHKTIEYGNVKGADIKVPWELSRFQHLPTLAWAYTLSHEKEDGFQPEETYYLEFKNQVIDFLATNPPRFGANWCCPMDVGIRIANIWVAYDMFAWQEREIDKDFNNLLIRSTYEHLQFILENLEWNPGLRSNHYLGDLMGLLFGSAHLPCNPKTDAILAFAIQELVLAMEEQFLPDGGNFEGSTAYHRLSGEMMAYATALILALPDKKQRALNDYDSNQLRKTPALKPAPLPQYPVDGQQRSTPFPPAFFEKLKNISRFMNAVTKPSGKIVQFGDNDSGRFLKLHPAYEMDKDGNNLTCNTLDAQHLSNTIESIFGNVEKTSIDAQVVSNMIGETIPASPTEPQTILIGDESLWTIHQKNFEKTATKQKSESIFSSQSNELNYELQLEAFPDFGLFVFQSRNLYAAVRCGPVGQNGNGGHAHNDALALELTIEGKDLLVDPGTYCYTPLPDQRNAYRSAHAHFVPRIEGREPNSLNEGLFRLNDQAQAQCLYFGNRGFIGCHKGYGARVVRLVEILESQVIVRDYFEGTETLLPLDSYQPPPFSPGYGKQIV